MTPIDYPRLFWPALVCTAWTFPLGLVPMEIRAGMPCISRPERKEATCQRNIRRGNMNQSGGWPDGR